MRYWLLRHSKAVAAAVLAAFCGALGAMLLDPASVAGSKFARQSYDSYFSLLALNDPPPANSPVSLVYLDLESHQNQHQDPRQPWPRELYAGLILRLKAAGARVVVFDVVFDSLGTNIAANNALREAMAAHGRVVLAGELRAQSSDAGVGPWGRAIHTVKPIEEFRQVAAGWGLGELAADEDFVVRRYYPRVASPGEPVDNLIRAAAQAYGMEGVLRTEAPSRARWLHYYGPPFSLPHRSFSQVLSPGDVSDAEFRDKIVFVGARPIAGLFQERRDEFRSPFHLWGEKDLFMPGVEVHATEMLNLLRNDWLLQPAPSTLGLYFLLIGAALGAGLVWLRPVPAFIAALLAGGMVIGSAIGLFRQSHVWFPWLIPALVQVPAALGGSILFNSLEWYRARRRLEAAKRMADARIREQAALIEAAHDAILVQSLDGRITYANPSAERLYGWSQDELREAGAAALFADAAGRQARQDALERGEWNGQLRQQGRSGKSFVLESRWTLLRDEAGQPRGLLVINSDVTEQKQLEAEALRMQRMEAVGSLASGMAHDLNNALAPVLMGAQLLRRDTSDEKARRILSLMESSTRRGADLVRQVLLFARGRRGDFERLEVGPLVKEMEKLARDTFPARITISGHVAADLWPVRGNATQVHQVLLNLCLNARDAMPAGGSLTLAADNIELNEEAASALPNARQGAFVVLMVSDTGTGIPPEVLCKVFEPFFTTKPEGQGTGLGLSTTARIVKAHDGFIQLQSEAGAGTMFEVYLPRFSEAPAPALVAEPPPPPRGDGQLILVADDEEAVRELLRRSLEDYGYRVVSVANGAEAVSFFKQQPEAVALLVTDQSMPVLDGVRTAAACREVRAALPVLFLSGDGEARTAGAPVEPDQQAGSLSKPIELDLLLHEVHGLLMKPRATV